MIPGPDSFMSFHHILTPQSFFSSSFPLSLYNNFTLLPSRALLLHVQFIVTRLFCFSTCLGFLFISHSFASILMQLSYCCRPKSNFWLTLNVSTTILVAPFVTLSLYTFSRPFSFHCALGLTLMILLSLCLPKSASFHLSVYFLSYIFSFRSQPRKSFFVER